VSGVVLAISNLETAAQRLLNTLTAVFFEPGSVFWAPTLVSALVIATVSLAWPRIRAGRRVAVVTLIRALFPKRWLRSPSSGADLGLFLFNAFPAGLIIGGMIASTSLASRPTTELLARVFGPSPAMSTPPHVRQAVVTLALFLAYEFGYWLDHYLSHKVPLLWRFHKVHHTAEVLSPLTVFRVHPVDTLVFLNILALVVGSTSGFLEYLFGSAPASTNIFGVNVFMAVFFFLTVHLQHSHIWISFPGALGRVLLSPAHHQIHHSADPVHYDKNFGSFLSLWDWIFGTLYVPALRRERLNYGVRADDGAASAHSVQGVLISPFVEAARLVCGNRPLRPGRPTQGSLAATSVRAPES
jgi:sterol desaturase/sphingolipid hydroxylase (fatty acid hydroxylase superfamily)